MNFSDFVTFYWLKSQRSGAAWTPAEIATDSGLDISIVNLYLTWCHDNGAGLTDTQLIAKFNGGYFLNQTPFGPIISPKVSPTPIAGTIGAMDFDAFWTRMGK